MSGKAEEDLGAMTLDKRNITIAKRWVISQRRTSGGFGAIYDAQEKENHEAKVIIKTERRVNKDYLSREADVYKIMNSKHFEGFAHMEWRGKIYYKEKKKRKGCSAIVLEVLGASLSDLFYKFNRCFSLKTVLMLADQMIYRIEQLHLAGFIHRDIKPGNFVMGLNENRNKVYLIDFGLASIYKHPNGIHIQYRENAPFRGTHRYASVNNHLHREQSRRDDLISLAYVLIYFIRGSLPWQSLPVVRKYRREEIGKKKLDVSNESLCSGLPSEFLEFLDKVTALQFDEEPPYHIYRKLFKRCLKREGLEYDYLFDWTHHADDVPPHKPQLSSISTLSEGGMDRPRFDPHNLKRILSESGNDNERPTKMQRQIVPPHTNPSPSKSNGEKDNLDTVGNPPVQSHVPLHDSAFGKIPFANEKEGETGNQMDVESTEDKEKSGQQSDIMEMNLAPTSPPPSFLPLQQHSSAKAPATPSVLETKQLPDVESPSNQHDHSLKHETAQETSIPQQFDRKPPVKTSLPDSTVTSTPPTHPVTTSAAASTAAETVVDPATLPS